MGLPCLRILLPSCHPSLAAIQHTIRTPPLRCISFSSVLLLPLFTRPCFFPQVLCLTQDQEELEVFSHTDAAAISSSMLRIAVIARIVDTLPPVRLAISIFTLEAGDPSAEGRLHADSRRVAGHATPMGVWVVDTDLSVGALFWFDAVSSARLICRLWHRRGGGRVRTRRDCGRCCGEC